MAADPYPYIRGYYLSADVAHDFGPGVLTSTPYNHGGPTANMKLPEKPKIEEDAAVDYIEEQAKNRNGNEFIENGSARRSKRIIFTIPTKTAVFSASSVPTLFEGGNDAIGIIQDAGSFITGYLGAKNVITFGSILDPAGKPISQSDAPIWYRPPDGAMAQIPLGPFGFDTTKIQEINVLGMTAGLVSSTFTLGDGRVLDAVTMNVYNPQNPGRKPINTTKIESSGFYTSIAKAEEAVKNPAAREIVQKNYGYLFNIGKTLGDAALVASAMPSFRSNDETQLLPNPLYGVGTPPARDRDSIGWHDWISGEPVGGPSILILKTGDRLNALRAQMENVPNILEQQAGKGRSVKQYLFTPGKADPGAILAAVNQGYKNLKDNVAGRYDTLIQNFKALLIGDSLNPLYTIFTETPTIQSSDKVGLVLAGKLIKILNECLIGLRNGILEWLDARGAFVPKNLDELEIFQTNYNSDVETCTRVAPQTTDVLYTKQGVTKITLKIIVSQLPKVIPQGYTCPLRMSLDISLWNAFRKLQGNGGGKGISAIIGTDVYNRFIVPMSTLVPIPDELKMGLVQRGGGDEEDLLNEFVNYVSGSPDEDIVMKGGAPVLVDDSNLKYRYSPNEFKIEFPLISSFGDYVEENLNVQDFKQTLVAIYDVALNRGGQTTIVDDTFLNEFMREVGRLTQQDPPLVTFSGGQAARAHTTSGTAAFNAFTYYINRMNTVDSGFIGPLPIEPDESTPIVSGNENTPPTFLVLERLFLEKAKYYMKVLKRQSYFNTSSIQKGGRRPLYRRRKTYRRKRRSNKTRKQ
jgi:hypothetical protein